MILLTVEQCMPTSRDGCHSVTVFLACPAHGGVALRLVLSHTRRISHRGTQFSVGGPWFKAIIRKPLCL